MSPTSVPHFSHYHESFLILAKFFEGERAKNPKGSKETLLKNWSTYNFPRNLETEQSTEFSRNVLEKMEHYQTLMRNNKNQQGSILIERAAIEMSKRTRWIDSSLTVLLAIDDARLLSIPKQAPNEPTFLINFVML
jgi:hypothetical protein